MYEYDHDDEVTVVTSNTARSSRATADSNESRATNTDFAHKAAPKSPIPKGMAIGDSGTTGNFVMTEAPVTNIRPTYNPVRITIPNGDRL